MSAAGKAKPPSMWRRLALVIALTALTGLAAASWIRIHQVIRDRNGIVTERLSGSARSFTRELSGRLALADALVSYLTATDAGATGALLRERMLPADAFRGVVLVPLKESAGDDGLAPDERLKLKAGQGVLKVIARDAAHGGTYLVHLVNAANAPQLAWFEFDPGWLWQGAEDLPDQASMVIIDAAQNIVFEGTPLPAEIQRMFARSGSGAGSEVRSDGAPLLRDWQQ